MDRRLIEAAQTGNVQDLHNLIKENPLVLRSAPLAVSETPLHIACIGGHIDYVKEVLHLRPEFAEELNQDGFSPLHIASGNGDIQIVKELLQVNCFLCLIKGRERRIPLHYAAIKGRIHVIHELLSACAESVGYVTGRGETILHLALKNNQFEAFEFLVQYLIRSNNREILNKKDHQGESILHLAVSRKQYEQVIDFMLDKNVFHEGRVEVNSLNKRGFTPIDSLLSEGGDREIEEMLKAAGARMAADLQSPQNGASSDNLVVTTQSPSPFQSRRVRAQSPSAKLLNYFKFDKLRDSPNEVRNTLLVLAVLIATATYQAVLSPPGGVWQDDSLPSQGTGTNATSTKPHKAGEAVMGTHRKTSYGLFLIFNSIGFFMSTFMINVLTAGFPLRMELQLSLLALMATYDTSMAAISPDEDITLWFTILSAVLPVLIPIVTKIMRDHCKLQKFRLPCTSPATD
ncbi:ankyrin repeat-containing protein BDA1-like isoform X1 [Coffea arabica]|uniref:Ankyrin repeat-containing protein BDA1-like isoform X1 n=1 Tax=Coffea arabica TaxID=13443 RepID=A0A6P6W5Z1_COFAR|nr:ankyrin repeat-containing protein BDA1-like isoform X1 [Coffea arabica]XP_027109630.1 ankyrin repeat-containing protein BDA1-like isoform X1 [Coffea arabica]